jgi:hypothetical protein
MISDNLKELLLERNKESDLNFSKLVEVLDNSQFNFIGTTLRGPMGLATYKIAYFDMYRMNSVDNELLFFVILHEYCHVMKIDKIGKEAMVSQLSEEDFDIFFNHVVEEEILADRFGSYFYYNFNKKKYPKYRTQQLDKQDYREQYVDKIIDVHGQIKDERSYNKLIDYFIIDELD